MGGGRSRRSPDYIRSDNGPEFTARAVREWLHNVAVNTLFIEPGSPWENGYNESFNGKLRDCRVDGERIMAFAEDGILRVWPIPEGAPVHTLPLDELLTLLRAQTNIRVVSDTNSPDAYRIEHDNFDCWENPPTW